MVIDSYSTDATLEIIAKHPQVEVFQREFDHFANQCNYGLQQVETPWVLSLDADYMVSGALVDEICCLPPEPAVDGYSVSFVYCVFGEPLRGTLYPPRTVLYQKEEATYRRDGHAHRVEISGTTEDLSAPIYHDDRKPLRRWLGAQEQYVQAELKKYRSTPRSELSWTDWLRRTKWAPLLMFFYCLVGKGLLLDGKAGWYYALQRTYAELLLILKRLDQDLRSD